MSDEHRSEIDSLRKRIEHLEDQTFQYVYRGAITQALSDVSRERQSDMLDWSIEYFIERLIDAIDDESIEIASTIAEDQASNT